MNIEKRRLELAVWHAREATLNEGRKDNYDYHIDAALEYLVLAGSDAPKHATPDTITDAILRRCDALGIVTAIGL
jgi:hypothetical protein